MSTFSFVILTDSHVRAEPTEDSSWWNTLLVRQALEILSVAVKDANALNPDFVVHCGDLTDAADSLSFRAAGEVLRRLNCPLYFTPGNHDTHIDGSRDQAAKVLDVPGPPFYYTAVHKGWRLLFIDTAHWKYKDGSVHPYLDWDRYDDMYIPDSQVDWVRRELESDPDTPTLCFTHTPLALRDAYPGGSLPDGTPVDALPLEHLAGELCLNPKLKAVLAEHACIKAVFSGHGHWHECVVEGPTLYCQTAALAEYPNEFRRVHVSADRIEVQVVPLSRDGFPEMSYRPEAGNRWPAGRPQDRAFSHSI